MQEQQARVRLAGHDQARGHLEIAARLRLAPEAASRRELLQLERVVAALRVAHVAARMPGPLLEEDRLDAGLEELVIERLCPGAGRRGLQDKCDSKTDEQIHDAPKNRFSSFAGTASFSHVKRPCSFISC